MTAKHLAIQHARQNDVVSELRLANTLRARVDLAKRLSDDVQRGRLVSFATHSVLKQGYRITELQDVILHHEILKSSQRASIQPVNCFPRQFHLFAAHLCRR